VKTLPGKESASRTILPVPTHPLGEMRRGQEERGEQPDLGVRSGWAGGRTGM